MIMTTMTVLMAPLAASGHYLWHEDARDTNNSVDLQGVRLLRRSDPNRGVLRARTFEDIDLGENPAMTLVVDSRNGRRPDRSVRLEFDGGSSGWICSIFNVKTDEWIGGCESGHSERIWRITFPWSVLDATRHVRWYVVSTIYLTGDDEHDYAPNVGWFEH